MGRLQGHAGLCCIALIVAGRAMPQSATPQVPQKVVTPSAGGNSYDGPEFVKYPKDRDAQDRRIDMFIGDWRESMPRHMYGSLIVRDVLTRGDNFAPPEKAAVLQRSNFLAYATLPAHASTLASKLDGHQEIYYMLSGRGQVTAGGDTAELHKDIAILMPAGLEFVMVAGDEPLTMYVIDEPTPNGFAPKAKMATRDERTAHVRVPAAYSPYTAPGASGHWTHIVRELFSRDEGLATLGAVITVTLNPMTIGEPHSHAPGHEEVWAAIEGTSLAFLGTELRLQRPGMAYMLRPDSHMVHANINHGDAPVKFLWF